MDVVIPAVIFVIARILVTRVSMDIRTVASTNTLVIIAGMTVLAVGRAIVILDVAVIAVIIIIVLSLVITIIMVLVVVIVIVATDVAMTVIVVVLNVIAKVVVAVVIVMVLLFWP